MSAIQVECLLSGLRDTNGEPLSGGLVYTFETDGSTPKSTYTDRAMTTPETNPIVLDANGQAQVYAEGSYSFVVKTAAEVELYTWDNLVYELPTDTSVIFAGDSTGSLNAYVIAPSPAISALTDGQVFVFMANHTNTGWSSLKVNSLSAKAIRRDGTTRAVQANDITSGYAVQVVWDSTADCFQIVNPRTVYAGDIGTDQIAADAVTGPKIRLANNSALRINKADGTAVNAFYFDTGDQLRVNAPASEPMLFCQNGSTKWYFEPTYFDLLAITDDMYTIGQESPENRLHEVFTHRVNSGSDPLLLDTNTSSYGVSMRPGGTARMEVNDTYINFTYGTTTVKSSFQGTIPIKINGGTTYYINYYS